MTDGLEWLVDIPVGINLEPRTLYYFEPNIVGGELRNFMERMNTTGHEDIFNWINEWDDNEQEVKYFCIDSEMCIMGWCNITSLEDAMEFHYTGCNMIDGRTL